MSHSLVALFCPLCLWYSFRLVRQSLYSSFALIVCYDPVARNIRRLQKMLSDDTWPLSAATEGRADASVCRVISFYPRWWEPWHRYSWTGVTRVHASLTPLATNSVYLALLRKQAFSCSVHSFALLARDRLCCCCCSFSQGLSGFEPY